MISITKEEKELLVKLYPRYKYPRTMKQDSKRHHYFCTESEELMRAISQSNEQAAQFVKEIDQRRALRKEQAEHQRKVRHGSNGTV